MSRKISPRVFLALALVLVLTFFVVAIPTKIVHAQIFTVINVTKSDCKPYPLGAHQPVTCYWDTVSVKEGIGTSPACISLPPDGDNPLGYYTTYKDYYRWSYTDANGVSFVGWFADGQSGPYHIVGSSSRIECGTGA